MDRENVNLIYTNEAIDDPVRWMNHLADERIFEFRNGPTRFREGGQSTGRSNQLGDDDRCVMRRVLTDEGANSREIGTGLIGPENNPHGKNCFLTSSWDTSWRASDWPKAFFDGSAPFSRTWEFPRFPEGIGYNRPASRKLKYPLRLKMM